MGSICLPSSVSPYSTRGGISRKSWRYASPSSIICLRLSVRTFWDIPSRSRCSSLNLHGRDLRLRSISSFHFPPISDTAVATGQTGSSSLVFFFLTSFSLQPKYITHFKKVYSYKKVRTCF